mmetsp:Transcript_222/g.213  ORF Transcript_222/g.213 Transcript_222/m.213 type:complete len:148 (-) Transcript_222:48-491(-)
MIVLHLLAVIQLFFYIIYYSIVEDSGQFYSFHPTEGMFGWASQEYILFSLLLVGPFSCLLGMGGYIFMLDFFPAHIVASIFLLEPISGQLLGIFLQQDNYPHLMTYFGTLGILVGLGFTIKGDILKRDTTEAIEIEELEMSKDSLLA